MPDPFVQVLVRGMAATIGDGHANADCYFTNDGSSPLPLANVLGSSKLVWNAVVAKYDIDANDEVLASVRGYTYRVVTSGGNPHVLTEYV